MVDAHIHQEVDLRKFDVNVDRAKAQQFGLTQRDVAQSMLISLSGSYHDRAESVGESSHRHQLPGNGTDATGADPFRG